MIGIVTIMMWLLIIKTIYFEVPSLTSIFMSITPQPEVTSYSAILGYVDYNSNQKFNVLDGIITTDSSKQFIELKKLLRNVLV
jgi:hypothetical protein